MALVLWSDEATIRLAFDFHVGQENGGIDVFDLGRDGVCDGFLRPCEGGLIHEVLVAPEGVFTLLDVFQRVLNPVPGQFNGTAGDCGVCVADAHVGDIIAADARGGCLHGGDEAAAACVAAVSLVEGDSVHGFGGPNRLRGDGAGGDGRFVLDDGGGDADAGFSERGEPGS